MSANSGVGMPASLILEQFGQLVRDAFGEVPYHVGSSLCLAENTQWRDVDVRLILDDADYAAQGFGDPDRAHSNMKWVAFTIAFSALGKQMTGLPIDFQIQQRTHANAKDNKPRSALGIRRDLDRSRDESPDKPDASPSRGVIPTPLANSNEKKGGGPSPTDMRSRTP